MPDADAEANIDSRIGIDERDLDLIVQAAEEGARIAMRHFRADPQVWYKHEGNSPVSAADLAVDRYLRDTLIGARPDYGWLSEETVDSPDRLEKETVFVVDPIDGTRAFIAGKPTWCVSVAVVTRGTPVAGVLVAPALAETFVAGPTGLAFKNREGIAFDPMVDEGRRPLQIAAPESLVKGLAERIRRPIERVGHVPSLAYRLAMIADGRIDATLVKARSNDWDIAAADLILRRTGGSLTSTDARPILYNRPETDHGILVGARSGLMPDLAREIGSLFGDPAQH